MRRSCRPTRTAEASPDADRAGAGHGGGMTPPIVVHPPGPSGGRRVTARTRLLGLARSAEELTEIMHAAGLAPGEIDLADPHLVEWRGGGPDTWE